MLFRQLGSWAPPETRRPGEANKALEVGSRWLHAATPYLTLQDITVR